MILPKLRADLNISPSPDPQNPGLFLRDHFRYSDAWIIIPSALVSGLQYFDGARSDMDLQAEFARIAGEVHVAATAAQLIEALDKAGFLDNQTFSDLRDSRHRAFAASPVRVAVHSGSGYPSDVQELHKLVQEYLTGPAPAAQPGAVGIAAPHVSPGGGRHCYGAAYRTLTPDLRDRTFVILGTSHYGQANRFGLTRKPFETPFGITETDDALLDELAQQPAVIMEDYCEAIEHSIEFQVVFLQHLYGPNVKILPLLCGSFGPSIVNDGRPEDDDLVRRFFDTLGEIAERERDRLFWVLGVDMAHVGIRYGEQFAALADQNEMVGVGERDMDRIASLLNGDADGFWQKVKVNRDDIKWCGSAPFYTFMKVVPGTRGALRRYEQWNIDPQSVVSFAGISFTKA